MKKEDKRCTVTEVEEVIFGIDKLNVSRPSMPAITHVDYSASIQTKYVNTNAWHHAVNKKFKEKTGCPLVPNTSFNVGLGEPIICTPLQDALKLLYGH